MPRPQKAQPEPPNSFVASAAQVVSRRKRGKPRAQSAAAWQAEVQQMLYEVGELEFYREWISNALSRVTLYVTQEAADGTKTRVDTGIAADALAALAGGEQGQSQMLGRMAGLLSFPGECNLVGLLQPSDDPDGPDMWRVLSRNEVKQENGKVTVDTGDGEPEVYNEGRGQLGDEGYQAAEVYVARIWEPDPFVSVEAHSSVRSALPILRQIVKLEQKVAADIDSRLAGAGLLILPQEATFTSPAPGQAPEDPTADPLMMAIAEAAAAAIADRGDASANVPIIVRVPAQYVEHVKHITFWSEFSGQAGEERAALLVRLATTLSAPAEVLTGMGDINHWGQWFTDETGIKMFIEPLVNTIVHGLTTRYLRPCLVGPNAGAMTIEQARAFNIEGDTSHLRQRPNRSAEAVQDHEDMLITDKARLRERGYDDADYLDPTSEEYRRRLLQKAAKGVQTADVTVAALAQLGVTLVPKPSEVKQTEPPAVGGPSAPPAIEPSRQDPPQEPTGPDPVAAAVEQARLSALALAAEGDVLRAVERAWNKAGKRRGHTRSAINADQLDGCLIGAWQRTERIAAMTGVDHDRLRRALDTYTRTLLVTGAEYDPPAFAAMLRDEVLAEPLEAIGA